MMVADMDNGIGELSLNSIKSVCNSFVLMLPSPL